MGRLVIAKIWIKEKFERKSRPSVDTVRQWVEADQVPGVVLGDDVYIYADLFDVEKAKPEKLTAYSLLA